MATILIIGIDPQYLDFGVVAAAVDDVPTPERIISGLEDAKSALQAQGHRADIAWIDLGESAAATVTAKIAEAAPDLVVIGGGIRLIKANTVLLESMVNTVVGAAPGARFAFNDEPGNTLEAAQRWL